MQSATLRGVEAVPVDVEVVMANGIPGFSIVGLADASVQESRERVKAALRSCGFSLPASKGGGEPGGRASCARRGRGSTCPSRRASCALRGS